MEYTSQKFSGTLDSLHFLKFLQDFQLKYLLRMLFVLLQLPDHSICVDLLAEAVALLMLGDIDMVLNFSTHLMVVHQLSSKNKDKTFQSQ